MQNITLLEASITISVTFSVGTLEDIFLLPQNLLTDQDERPRIPGYLSFKTLLACSQERFWFSIKSMTKFSSTDSILVQAIFESLFFKK